MQAKADELMTPPRVVQLQRDLDESIDKQIGMALFDKTWYADWYV